MSAPSVKPFNQKIRINALRLGALILIPLILFTWPRMGPEGIAIEAMEMIGAILIITCVLGRFWSILYVGGRKNDEVVTDGPYSMTRNPLYFFSTLGVLGIGLVFGKLSLALLLTVFAFAALYLTARREQEFLIATFGQTYRSYAARVPMFLPNPRLYHSPDKVQISVGALKGSLRDAFVFLAALPLAEFAEYFYDHYQMNGFSLL